MELAVPFNAVRARRAPCDARITEDRQPQLRSLHASSPGLHAQLAPRRQSAPKTSCRLPHPRSRNRRRGVVESHHGRWPIPQGIYPQPPGTAFVVRSRIAKLSFRVVARRKRGDSRRKWDESTARPRFRRARGRERGAVERSRFREGELTPEGGFRPNSSEHRLSTVFPPKSCTCSDRTRRLLSSAP